NKLTRTSYFICCVVLKLTAWGIQRLSTHSLIRATVVKTTTLHEWVLLRPKSRDQRSEVRSQTQSIRINMIFCVVVVNHLNCQKQKRLLFCQTLKATASV